MAFGSNRPAAQNADGEDECKEQFVLLKQRATNVAVNTAGKVVVEVLDALRKTL